jgi:hypothetical protein
MLVADRDSRRVVELNDKGGAHVHGAVNDRLDVNVDDKVHVSDAGDNRPAR